MLNSADGAVAAIEVEASSNKATALFNASTLDTKVALPSLSDLIGHFSKPVAIAPIAIALNNFACATIPVCVAASVDKTFGAASIKFSALTIALILFANRFTRLLLSLGKAEPPNSISNTLANVEIPFISLLVQPVVITKGPSTLVE